MDFRVFEGNILTSGADLIAHQVNCQGVMGTGLAKQIKDAYPDVYRQYKEFCYRYNYDRGLLGSMQLLKVSSGITQPTWVANLFGQYKYGRSHSHTDYEALRSALVQLSSSVYRTGIEFRLAMPYRLGCGAAGGNWDIVLEIIKKSLVTAPCTVELWRLGA